MFHVKQQERKEHKMGKIIAVVNQKGGVGKTTSAVNLTAALTESGKRVLLCDFDPQANATSGLGLDKRKLKHSVYDVVINDTPVKDAIVSTKFGDVLPSTADLAGAAVELISLPDANLRLAKALETVRGDYDLILIDCPPSLEMLTLNSLAAADGILVPVQCEYYALEGLTDLMTTLRMVKKRLNPKLEIFGVALTMFDGRTNFSTQVAQEVRRHFPGKVFSSVIPRNIRLAEAPSHGIPVTVYDRASRGAKAYKAMAEEIKKKL
jgi:chromosome partitioning protein